jgi:hypothetical protein
MPEAARERFAKPPAGTALAPQSGSHPGASPRWASRGGPHPPIKWSVNVALIGLRIIPICKFSHELCREVIFMTAHSTNIRARLTKLRWDQRPRSSPINKIMTDQHAIGLCVVFDVSWISQSIRITMMRFFLQPLTRGGPMIDVVPVCQHFAASHLRLFMLKANIKPILIKRQSFVDPHRENKMPLPPVSS